MLHDSGFAGMGFRHAHGQDIVAVQQGHFVNRHRVYEVRSCDRFSQHCSEARLRLEQVHMPVGTQRMPRRQSDGAMVGAYIEKDVTGTAQ